MDLSNWVARISLRREDSRFGLGVETFLPGTSGAKKADVPIIAYTILRLPTALTLIRTALPGK